tara:strand:+ start:5989 stop:6642 length:654 start_codon:yes stop_codon:yes gene_type:complete
MKHALLFLSILITAPFIIAHYAQAQNAQAPAELLQDPQDSVIEDPKALEPDPLSIPEPKDPNEIDLPFDSYSDIPPEALNEMQDFYKTCQNNYIQSLHYDCKCWSARFLEERIRIGPNAPKIKVITTITDECFNIPGAAGFALETCQKFGDATYDGGMGPEEYCQCIANNYALEFKQTRGTPLTTNRSNSMMTSAILRCKTPKNPGDKKIFQRLDKK